jgi:hypothetical protein
MKLSTRSIIVLAMVSAWLMILACDAGGITRLAFGSTPTPVPTAAPNVVVITATPAATPTPPRTATPNVIVVTATPEPLPKSFGAITFAPVVIGAEPNFKPVDAASRFPEGLVKIYAIFGVEAPLKSSQWRYEFLANGQRMSGMSGYGWDLNQPGTTWVSIWGNDGLEPGEWEMRLYLGDRIAQRATFTIAKRQAGAPAISVIRFAEDNQGDKPVNIHRANENFKGGTKKVWAFFDVSSLPKGTNWKWEWYRDGERIPNLSGSKGWEANSDEKNWWLNISDEAGLRAGIYELKLYIADQVAQIGTFLVDK